MVNHVMQEILDKRHNRELRTVRSDSAPRVLLGRERLDPGDETLCCSLEFVSNYLWILLAVTLFDRRLVLVPLAKVGVFSVSI
jgi:hypothetical protein